MKYTNTNTNPTIECAYKEVVIIGESIKCSYVDIYIYFTLAISLMRIHEQTHRKKQKTNKKNSSKFSKNGHRHNVNAMKRLNVKALIVKYIKNFCLEIWCSAADWFGWGMYRFCVWFSLPHPIVQSIASITCNGW